MKKLLVLMLALSLSLSLVACNKTSEDVYEVENDSVLTIENLFTEVKEDVQPGTAGCSLKSIIVAVDFMNFYSEDLNKEETVKAFEEKYLELSDDEKAEFKEAWNMVYSNISSFIGSGNDEAVKEQLDLAGCLDKNNYPWSETSIDVFDSINELIAK